MSDILSYNYVCLQSEVLSGAPLRALLDEWDLQMLAAHIKRRFPEDTRTLSEIKGLIREWLRDSQ